MPPRHRLRYPAASTRHVVVVTSPAPDVNPHRMNKKKQSSKYIDALYNIEKTNKISIKEFSSFEKS
ncbi:hypothetical protein T03_90 [Trichinella britovi]|uniref:Uncharacterized protein n=1 Tax=Trichinella britovi TaxID=45882 RepID=A0A0V1CVJ8_TRIBR|nr:hypothetical protein T03_90 [Trichinella britovi]